MSFTATVWNGLVQLGRSANKPRRMAEKENEGDR